MKLPPRVYAKHGAFYFVTLERKWIRLGKTRAEMYQKLSAIEGQSHHGTMSALINQYLREVTPNKAKASQDKDYQHAKVLKAWCGQESPENIRPTDIAQFLRRSTKKVAANRQKALLSHVFTMAMEWGYIDSNPCRGVRRNPEKARERYPEDWEVMTVWNLASQRMRWLIALAYMTGQRRGDLLGLHESHLKPDGIFFRQAKTGKKLLVSYSPSIKIILAQMAEARNQMKVRPLDCPLFCSARGKPWRGANTEWQRIMVKSGIEPRFTFHDLRAKAASDSGNLELLGHASKDTTRRIYHRLAIKVKPV